MKKKRRNKRTKKNLQKTLISLLILILIAGLSLGSYCIYENFIKGDEVDPLPPFNEEDKNKPSTQNIISNETLNIPKGNIFYQSNTQDILNYYQNIDFNSNKDELMTSLFELLKKDQIKVEYDGKNKDKNMNLLWANYCLVDRNYLSSPLKQEEIKTEKREMNVKLDILYLTQDYEFNTNNKTKNLDREHIFPKSYGFNGTNDLYKKMYAGTDLHNLRSSDSRGNQQGHNNKLFDEVLENEQNKDQAINGETYFYSTEDYFYPPKEDRGDIARSIFYMATRYSKYYIDDLNNESPYLTLVDNPIRLKGTLEPQDTKLEPAKYGKLNTLLKWNEEDPVDEFEVVRNNLVYSLQNNRNPFVDYPFLANKLFS